MRRLMWAAVAAGFLVAGGSVNVGWAGDTVRLGGPAAAQVDVEAGIDTELVHGGGHGGGGHGGFHGGFHGGYGHGYYGGYRGYYGGYRGYYGGYRGYYGGYNRSYYSYYGPNYYPPVIYRPLYYSPYYYNSYYDPCVGQTAPALTLQINANSFGATFGQPANSEAIPAPRGDGTFPYNGGPQSPIPLPPPTPGQDTNPANNRGIIPLDGKLVSFPVETTGGFTPVGLPTIPTRTTTTTTTTIKTPTPTPRVNYPAYGDEPITPAPFKKR